jgi:hypothetical protein
MLYSAKLYCCSLLLFLFFGCASNQDLLPSDECERAALDEEKNIELHFEISSQNKRENYDDKLASGQSSSRLISSGYYYRAPEKCTLPRRYRSKEEISAVFDKSKGAIYSLYNRSLKKNPKTKGEIVFIMSISSTGRVSEIYIDSSQLNNPSLERKLLVKLEVLDFENSNANPVDIKVSYTFN